MTIRQTRRRRGPRHLGKQSPRYRFFLNPYPDVRFTSCPRCGGKARVRKLPLVIHIDPMQLAVLNKTCRYCPPCDLLIAHQAEIEAFVASFVGPREPDVVGKDYLVVGTEDRADWLLGMRTSLSTQEVLECLHDFTEVVGFERVLRRGWGPA